MGKQDIIKVLLKFGGNKNNGKCYIAVENNKAIALIIGCIFPYEEKDYLDYKCPKKGRLQN